MLDEPWRVSFGDTSAAFFTPDEILSMWRQVMGDEQDKAQENIDIQHDPSKRNPTLPVEAQMEKAGEPEPIKDQYKDSPPAPGIVYSTHDRDSVQPPDPTANTARVAPEMPLKDDREEK